MNRILSTYSGSTKKLDVLSHITSMVRFAEKIEERRQELYANLTNQYILLGKMALEHNPNSLKKLLTLQQEQNELLSHNTFHIEAKDQLDETEVVSIINGIEVVVTHKSNSIQIYDTYYAKRLAHLAYNNHLEDLKALDVHDLKGIVLWLRKNSDYTNSKDDIRLINEKLKTYKGFTALPLTWRSIMTNSQDTLWRNYGHYIIGHWLDVINDNPRPELLLDVDVWLDYGI